MAKTFQLCVLCVLEGPRCKRGTGREEKSLKTLPLAEPAEKGRRQNTEAERIRRQKTGDRRGFEGWRCSKKSEKKGVEEPEKRRIRGVKDSRGQVEKDRRLEGWKVRGLVKK